MAPSIQVFVQVVLLCCVVTTSMGGITDWQKAFSQLQNKVKVSQEEIESLHQIIVQLEKRLDQLEGKDEFGKFQIHSAFLLKAYSTFKYSYSSCLLVRTILLLVIVYMGLLHCTMSLQVGQY